MGFPTVFLCPNNSQIRRVRVFVDVVLASQEAHEPGGLLEDAAEIASLLGQHRHLVLHPQRLTQSTRFRGRTPRRLLALVELRHIHGVLKHVGHAAIGARQGRVGRAPEAIFQNRFPLRLPGNAMADQRQHLLHAGLQDPKQRLPDLGSARVLWIFRIVREDFKEPPAKQVFAPAARGLEVGLIRRDKAKLPVDHHVGVGRSLEHQAKVDLFLSHERPFPE
jgi:hypothetical protein